MVSAHSHEEVSSPLNPDQFRETCVAVDMEGRAGPVNPGTCSCNTADQRNTPKNPNILPREVCFCGCVQKSSGWTLETNVTTFILVMKTTVSENDSTTETLSFHDKEQPKKDAPSRLVQVVCLKSSSLNSFFPSYSHLAIRTLVQ